jgi:hypothetical protein
MSDAVAEIVMNALAGSCAGVAGCAARDAGAIAR